MKQWTAEEIKALREQRGITQQALADRLDLSITIDTPTSRVLRLTARGAAYEAAVQFLRR